MGSKIPPLQAKSQAFVSALHETFTWSPVVRWDAMVIAIDGPAGAGKSTVARAVAERLGFTYLDTGAMYRCVALGALRSGDPAAEVAERSQIEVGERVLLDGRDVTAEIRTPEVSAAASEVARDPAVRAALVRRQQELMATGDWVADGRDIGSVVAPDAEVKVFLYADPNERARRRAFERGEDAGRVRQALEERDRRDQTDGRSVLEPAPDAVPIDTTPLTVDEVVDQIATLVVEAQEIR
jgi:cytidylate kinase